MAAIDSSMLGKLCQEWIDSGSILLKHHAAEAAAWLPPDNLRTLDNHFIRGLQADPERRVREAIERSRKELRRRLWVEEHLAAVQAGDANDPNGWVLSNYGHGAALGRLGDDDTERQIREAAQRQDIPPNVRHWFETIAEKIERQWRDTTRKWPESWLPWKGSVDQVEGQIGIGDTLYAAQLTLWLSPREDDLSLPPWGGAATLRDANPFFALQLLQSVGDNKGAILIAGRNRAEVLIVDADGTQVIFVGSDSYPER
jgi:hypothetical protein